MHKEVPWLVSLCVQERILDPVRAAEIAYSLPETSDALGYGQALLDQEITADVDLLTRLVEEAQGLALSGTEAPALAAPPPARPPVPADPAWLSVHPATVPAAAGQIDFSPVESLSAEELKAFMLGVLATVQTLGASDLHLSAGAPPYIRNMRTLEFLSTTPLSPAQSERLNACLLAPDEAELFSRRHDYDYALAMEGGRRIRVNLMLHKDGVKGTYRIVPEHIRTPAELGFKNTTVLDKLLSYHNGLVLVTGPVGAGKTTTLNSLIDQLNRTREDHIITVEDPIEFLHLSQGCNITQRQAGHHTNSFASALKAALREDPDVIVIGELRDLETIEMAISASETGHLVIGTMHTSDATSTLNRLLDVFPPGQQSQIRAMVAQSLRGVLCQRLLPAKQGGVVLAAEILVNTLAVSSMIRDGKTQGIPSALDTGKREGMISMDNSILDLFREGKITAEVARTNILNKAVRASVPGND
jgi:twitching motility protein PilT